MVATTWPCTPLLRHLVYLPCLVRCPLWDQSVRDLLPNIQARSARIMFQHISISAALKPYTNFAKHRCTPPPWWPGAASSPRRNRPSYSYGKRRGSANRKPERLPSWNKEDLLTIRRWRCCCYGARPRGKCPYQQGAGQDTYMG